jgi:hypothetical protein
VACNPSWPGQKNVRYYLKNNLKAKRAGGMAQVTKQLPSKPKDLNSNTCTAKRKGGRERVWEGKILNYTCCSHYTSKGQCWLYTLPMRQNVYLFLSAA